MKHIRSVILSIKIFYLETSFDDFHTMVYGNHQLLEYYIILTYGSSHQ